MLYSLVVIQLSSRWPRQSPIDSTNPWHRQSLFSTQTNNKLNQSKIIKNKLHKSKKKKRFEITFCDRWILRSALWTSGLLSSVDDWLDGGCEYSEVFSSSDAKVPLNLLVVVCLNRRVLQPGPIGRLAMLFISSKTKNCYLFVKKKHIQMTFYLRLLSE